MPWKSKNCDRMRDGGRYHCEHIPCCQCGYSPAPPAPEKPIGLRLEEGIVWLTEKQARDAVEALQAALPPSARGEERKVNE